MTTEVDRSRARAVQLSIAIAIGVLATPVSAASLRAAFVPRCPTTLNPTNDNVQPESVLATGLLTAFAGKLVDAGIAKLKEIVNPKLQSVDGQFMQEGLYSYGLPKNEKDTSKARTVVNPAMTCLVVALADDPIEPSTWVLPFDVPSERASTALQELKNALELRAPPHMYFEAVRQFSTDRTAVTWRVVRFYVGQYLNDSFWAGDTRAYKVTMGLSKPGETTTFFSQQYDFPSVRKPFNETPHTTTAMRRGSWGKLPAPPDKPPTGHGFAVSDRGIPYMPYTLSVLIAETPKPYELAQVFVASIESQSGEIKKQVGLAIDKDANQTAEQTGQLATLVAIDVFLKARGEAQGACTGDKVKTPEGKYACGVAVDKQRIAREKADFACKIEAVESCKDLPANFERPV